MGDPAHSAIVIDFLNAVVEPAVPINRVEIKKSVHVLDFIGDAYTVGDVQAADARGCIFQVEMQSWTPVNGARPPLRSCPT